MLVQTVLISLYCLLPFNAPIKCKLFVYLRKGRLFFYVDLGGPTGRWMRWYQVRFSVRPIWGTFLDCFWSGQYHVVNSVALVLIGNFLVCHQVIGVIFWYISNIFLLVLYYCVRYLLYEYIILSRVISLSYYGKWDINLIAIHRINGWYYPITSISARNWVIPL